MDQRRDPRSWAHRAGESAGLIRPSSGPRTTTARIFDPDTDSSLSEILTGLAVTALVLASELTFVFGINGPAWLRPLAAVVALLFVARLVHQIRLLKQRYLTRRATRSAK